MLELRDFSCGYGAFQAVGGLNLTLKSGTMTGLLGANGAGKSSTLMCLAGHVAQHGGQTLLDGRDITRIPAVERVRLGLAIAPEGRRLFKDLSVEDNLRMGAMSQPVKHYAPDRATVLDLFPRLGERLGTLAGNLSGGEQQMLAIGRALMARPRLLMIDELSLGLMPKVIDLCYEALQTLRQNGLTILLVEQNTTRALHVADSVCVLESGRAVWQGSAADAARDPALSAAYLGLGQSQAANPGTQLNPPLNNEPLNMNR